MGILNLCLNFARHARNYSDLPLHVRRAFFVICLAPAKAHRTTITAMNAISTLLLMLPFLLPILLANLGEKERSVRLFAYIYLALLNGVLALAGFFSLAAGIVLSNPGVLNQMAEQNPGLNVEQLRQAQLGLAGVLLILFAIIAIVVLLPKIRSLIARVLPIDAGSAIHATALSMTASAFGINLFQMIALGPLVFAVAASEQVSGQLQQSYLDVLVFPLLTLVIAALLGVGLYIRRDQSQTLARLGLTRPTARHIGIALGTTIGLLALSILTNVVWQAIDPQSLNDVGGVLEAITRNLNGIPGALAIGLSAAIGEETFFRGAYQPRMGLPLAALLFASFHVQYAVTPATLLVLVIGVVLGVLRQRTSLTVCIVVHFLFNFVSVLLP
jgi:membrane protease YdiL (CAAX protease family)